MNNITPINSSQIDEARQNAIAERLCEKTPIDNLRHMETVSKNHGLSMILKTETQRGENGKWVTRFVYAKFAVDASNDKRREVANAFKTMLTPPPRNAIITWLSELALKATKKNGNRVNDAIELNAYADELEGYPADVVKYALAAKHHDWWPSVAQILKICDEQSEDRVQVIRKLENLIARHKDDVPTESKEDTQTKREKFQTIDEILKNAGFTPKVAWKD